MNQATWRWRLFGRAAERLQELLKPAMECVDVLDVEGLVDHVAVLARRYAHVSNARFGGLAAADGLSAVNFS